MVKSYLKKILEEQYFYSPKKIPELEYYQIENEFFYKWKK